MEEPSKVELLNTSGFRIYYEVLGEGSPVVLLHANMLDCRMWDQQVGSLSRRLQVIRFDLPGYGRSPMPDHAFALWQSLGGLLDALGTGPVHLVGLSMGGRVAIDYALVAPERVASLTLASSTLGGYTDWSGELVPPFVEIVGAASRGDRHGVRKRFLAFPPNTSAAEIPTVKARLEEMIDGYSWVHFTRAGWEQMPEPPALDRLAEITCPVLIINGARDALDYVRLGEVLADRIVGSHRVVIDDAGHMVNMERADRFNEVVLEFALGQASGRQPSVSHRRKQVGRRSG